jgi:magnesium transporter
METELETIEAEIFKRGSARQNIERLYSLKRRAGVLRHAVLPLMEATGKLFGGRVPRVCESSQDDFRDVYDHRACSNATLESLRETIATAIQVNLSMVTMEESEMTKRPAAWAGILAVATAFVGLWGMNFEHMPELKWRRGDGMSLLAIGGVCGLMFRRFRKAGWL